MAFHGVHQVGQRRLQAFSANTVGGFPDHDHRLLDRLIVDPPALGGTPRVLIIVHSPQQPDAVLAMVSGDRDELVEDPALVLFGRAPVTVPYCIQQLLLRHLAYASTHVVASEFSVTF